MIRIEYLVCHWAGGGGGGGGGLELELPASLRSELLISSLSLSHFIPLRMAVVASPKNWLFIVCLINSSYKFSTSTFLCTTLSALKKEGE